MITPAHTARAEKKATDFLNTSLGATVKAMAVNSGMWCITGKENEVRLAVAFLEKQRMMREDDEVIESGDPKFFIKYMLPLTEEARFGRSK